jgi:elongation factor Ts
MAEFTAQDVQALRRATGAGMLDAKRALEAAGGDADKAAVWLREQGLAGAAKRSDREATQGAVSLAVSPEGAALVELCCETDFVAKSSEFVALADELADSVASKGESAAAELSGAIDRLKTILKENVSLGRVVRFVPGEGSVIGSYLHHQADRGVNGVIVELSGGDDALAHDIAVHIAFSRPQYLRREDVPAEEVAAERGVVEQVSRNEGKPEASLPKIVEGRMNGWFKERCLLEQPYVRDEKHTVAEHLSGAVVVRFAQVVVGS